MAADSTRALPPGSPLVVTPSADTASYPVIVDRHHARAHAEHKKRRDHMHIAGAQPYMRATEDTTK